MTSVDEVFDAGLQIERTALSWRRSALATGTVVVGCARVALHDMPVASLLFAICGVLVAVGLFVHPAARYRYTHRILVESGQLARERGAGPAIMVTCGLSLVLGVLALHHVLPVP